MTTPIPTEKLDKLVERWTSLQSELSQNVSQATRVQLAKEFSELNPVVEAIREYRKAETEWSELKALSSDTSADKELREMAHEELGHVDDRRGSLLEKLRVHLLPKDAADEKSAILEVRAGTGGDEAALFAADLFRTIWAFLEIRHDLLTAAYCFGSSRLMTITFVVS